MVLRVADIAKQSKYLDGIIIATEDKIIQDLANENDYLSIVTSSHYTCTHRVAEVAGSVLPTHRTLKRSLCLEMRWEYLTAEVFCAAFMLSLHCPVGQLGKGL